MAVVVSRVCDGVGVCVEPAGEHLLPGSEVFRGSSRRKAVSRKCQFIVESSNFKTIFEWGSLGASADLYPCFALDRGAYGIETSLRRKECMCARYFCKNLTDIRILC